jgi:hypothetical protein
MSKISLPTFQEIKTLAVRPGQPQTLSLHALEWLYGDDGFWLRGQCEFVLTARQGQALRRYGGGGVLAADPGLHLARHLPRLLCPCGPAAQRHQPRRQR